MKKHKQSEEKGSQPKEGDNKGKKRERIFIEGGERH